MKKLLIASAITLAGITSITAVSYADVSTQRRNSKYCRLSNSTDVLCTGKKKWKAGNSQGLVIARNKAEIRTKYCRQDSTEGDPLCEPQWKTDPADYDEPVYEDPAYE